MSDADAELQRRLAILSQPSAQGEDFDGRSWFWLILLGAVLPLALIILGWKT